MNYGSGSSRRLYIKIIGNNWPMASEVVLGHWAKNDLDLLY